MDDWRVGRAVVIGVMVPVGGLVALFLGAAIRGLAPRRFWPRSLGSTPPGGGSREAWRHLRRRSSPRIGWSYLLTQVGRMRRKRVRIARR